MATLKKIKKWASRAHRDGQRAELAADRAEAALRQMTERFDGTDVANSHSTDPQSSGPRRAAFYTGPAGRDATPPVAQPR